MSVKAIILSELLKSKEALCGSDLIMLIKKLPLAGWNAIAPSTVYRALLSLEKSGFIRHASKYSGFKNRTPYRITERGKGKDRMQTFAA